jgi:circadian clock protein KaiC
VAKKISTGIDGLDTILEGGYLEGCPTLIKGGPGSGKTFFSLLFAQRHYSVGRKVVYVTCDESPEAILSNLEALDLNGKKAIADTTALEILDMRPNPEEKSTGEYELSAVLFRIKQKIDKKLPIVIIDSVQNLLFDTPSKLAEYDFFRLFSWARENKLTLLITNVLESLFFNRARLEEYAVDCVIQLQQDITKNVMTRYLLVQKMRGSAHGTNKYPFCLTPKGVSLFPITGSGLQRNHSFERMSSGITELDRMLGGGLREKTAIMISGSSGTAKTLLAATIAKTTLKMGRKVLFFSFEESINDLLFNIKSIGIHLDQHIKKKQCIIKATRSSEMGLEEHLIRVIDLVHQHHPHLIVIDPITSLADMGSVHEVKDTLVRFLTVVKEVNTTILFTELLKTSEDYTSVLSISSIIDTMILLDTIEHNGESNRTLKVTKTRGSASSNQIKEFKITNDGIKLENPYIGRGGILYGSEKSEMLEKDKNFKKSLEQELITIKSGIKILTAYSGTEEDWRTAKIARLKQQLIAKYSQITTELDNIMKSDRLNKKLRGGFDDKI